MAEARKRALIGAALREISDHGSLEVTVAQIAGRAGVSPALAHHYFGGKDDLILATMGHLLAEFRAVLVEGLARADGPRAPEAVAARLSFFLWAELAGEGLKVETALADVTDKAAIQTAIVGGSFGPEQFHRATISAWLTFYAWALSSPGAARLLRLYQRRLHSNLVHDLRGLVPPAEAARIAEGAGALIDGVYLREALKGRPTRPETAIATVETYLDHELGSLA
ncbi:TetR family transcriptional regulator C-terminal domain-containing protein [Amaricoccus sp.]|uniref:TetR family transcriptional regulator C-terminal domain-containing protein n=1 Tax=Amaricoccus sp. TaxID=1872485 RepID=UPI00261654D2|nr:TetR family transcriptional regulator C-terminal domain-containing protein [Amaricoccus sp.]HRO12538.1 TetR family transcriptional regulator C-terminal domain-containing protein [Amaricoccus sp.]